MLRAGFTSRTSRHAAGELLPHLSTLTRQACGISLLHFPWGRPRRALSRCIRRISTGKRNCARSTANMSRTIFPAARGRRKANVGCSDQHKKHAPLTEKRRFEAAVPCRGSVCVFEKVFCVTPWRAVPFTVSAAHTNSQLKCLTERIRFFVLTKPSEVRRTGGTLNGTRQSQSEKDGARIKPF